VLSIPLAVNLLETPVALDELPPDLFRRALCREAGATQLGRLSCCSKACRLVAEEEAHAKVSQQQGESVLGPGETWAQALLHLELRLSSKEAARALPAHADEDEPVGVYSADADGTGQIIMTLSGTLACSVFSDKGTLNNKGSATGYPIMLKFANASLAE
jgi:hypothetical protein